MFLFKRPNGHYYIYYRKAEGKWTSISTKTTQKTEANKFFSDLKQNIHRIKPPTTLSEFIKQYLAYSRINHAPGTTQRAEFVLNHFTAFIGERMLGRVTVQDIEAYKAIRLGKGISPVTVNIELRTLKAFFNVAVEWELIESSPFRKSKLLRIPDSSPPHFTQPEFQQLLNNVLDRRLKSPVIFAAYTGLRRGEIINLRWDAVDFTRNIIMVRNTDTFTTKSKRERIVPLNPEALRVLKELSPSSEYVFTDSRQRQIIGKRLSEKFGKAVKAAKLNPKLHFHSLRHTFASWLVQAGVSLYEVQRLLGHSNLSVTQVYSHLQPEQLHSTVNKISLPLN